MLIPALDEPTLTDEHTRSVQASASGIAAISFRSASVDVLLVPRVFAHAVRDEPSRLRRGGDQRDGCDGNPLIDDGNAEFPLDLFSRCDQALCIAADLVVDLFTRTLCASVRAGEERDAHRDRADIQMLLVDHTDRFQNIIAA